MEEILFTEEGLKRLDEKTTKTIETFARVCCIVMLILFASLSFIPECVANIIGAAVLGIITMLIVVNGLLDHDGGVGA